MSLINQTYFVGELSIPYVGNAPLTQRLEAFIKKYEAEFLRNVMGYEMYKEYVAAPTVSRFVDLIEGTEYTVYGTLHKWDGLVSVPDERSIIANYVYYWWTRDQATQSSSVGEVATKTENATRVSPIQKMVDAWNEMVYQVRVLWQFLDNNKTTYPEWSLHYYARDSFELINTSCI